MQRRSDGQAFQVKATWGQTALSLVLSAHLYDSSHSIGHILQTLFWGPPAVLNFLCVCGGSFPSCVLPLWMFSGLTGHDSKFIL